MAKTFVNPFHFIPATDPVDPIPIKEAVQTLGVLPRPGESWQPSHPELLHDRYLADDGGDSDAAQYYSGRIICRIQTKSPCVFGNQHRKVAFDPHSDDVTTIVDNLSIDGHAAIAGTTLKGMFSTIAEMASGSAMRVLNNRVFSIRSMMTQSRSAVGMVIGEVADKNRKILPLTLPTFTRRLDGHFHPTFPSDPAGNKLWHEIRARRIRIDSRASLTAAYIPKQTKADLCFRDRSPIVGLLRDRLPAIRWDDQEHRPHDSQPKPLIKPFREDELLRPAKFRGRDLPLPKPFVAGSGQVPGIVRSLGRPDPQMRNKQRQPIPIYAQFVPISERWIDNNGDFLLPEQDIALLLDAEQACHEFDRIVTDPFSNAPSDKPACTVLKRQKEFRLPKRKGDKLKNKGLRQGDLVFFRPRWSAEGNEIEVESVSISSIWREGVRWIWDPQSGEPDLLDSRERRPLHKGRQTVTMAERMFGWVGDSQIIFDEDQERPPAPITAYKGRIRFSDAVSNSQLSDALMPPHQKQYDLAEPAKTTLAGYYPLKILASPKPPCPELYCYDQSDRKSNHLRTNFLKGSEIKLQGTKFYWRRQQTIDGDGKAIWLTNKASQSPDDRLKQKSWVRPLRSGTEFYFHVDFENLNQRELELLCYALKPAPEFVHQCGFAKPVGLGAIDVQPAAIALIDRTGRYATDHQLLTRSQRYRLVQLERGLHVDDPDDSIPARYRGMLAAGDSKGRMLGAFSESFANAIADLHPRIVMMGTPVAPQGNCDGVMYPVTVGQDGETKLYNWFTKNRDKHGVLKQPPLQPLPEQGGEVPKMNRW